MKTKILWVIMCLFVTGCTRITTQPVEVSVPTTPTIQPAAQNMVNPASAFCEQNGYDLEIRTAADGSQSGVCIFPDGSECDEWAYYRGECKPPETTSPPPADDSNDWLTYTNDEFGYSFQYPVGAQITLDDEPKRGLSISGASLGNEFWGIAHPSDREDYRPPEDVDLWQWLTEHYLVGDQRLPDEQIAGITAIHFRHAPSAQSYAFDTYYLARSGQLYQLSIGHSSDNEDWELDNRFLQSFQFITPEPTASGATAIPTALPMDPTAYQDWQTYTHPVYNFSIRVPDDWVVEEVTGGGPDMDGHLLNLRPVDTYRKESIRLAFRSVGEETPLWPTSAGQGDFIPGGNIEIAGKSAQRMLLVCPTGEITSIWYLQAQDQPNLNRNDLEFGNLFSATSIHCEVGYSLSGKTQWVGEMIISALSVP